MPLCFLKTEKRFLFQTKVSFSNYNMYSINSSHFWIKMLGLVQTSNFSCAEPNVYDLSCLSLGIRFGT